MMSLTVCTISKTTRCIAGRKPASPERNISTPIDPDKVVLLRPARDGGSTLVVTSEIPPYIVLYTRMVPNYGRDVDFLKWIYQNPTTRPIFSEMPAKNYIICGDNL